MVNIGYARVSTDGQSLDVQLAQLQKAGCGKIFQEKISGAKHVRPQLVALLDYVREGDTVTITKANNTKTISPPANPQAIRLFWDHSGLRMPNTT